MFERTGIKVTPEAEEAGRLYREAIRLAEAGKYDEAVASASAIEGTNSRFAQTFRNEAMLGIVHLCCDAGQVEKAAEIAGRIDAPRLRRRAFEVISSRPGTGAPAQRP